jgi:hypothetical protein
MFLQEVVALSVVSDSLMTSAVAVVRASLRTWRKHERDKDVADKPLAIHPLTSKMK